jgi:NAD(P)-dependent dehydrogenase (short-subunit alcohol dehydrogenase family)
MSNFKDKVVIVTGGSQGIGRGITDSFIEEGANVVVIGKTDIRIEDATYYSVDLTNRYSRLYLIDKIFDKFGRIDILVNNAGTQEKDPFVDYAKEKWDEQLELLLTVPFDLSQQASKYMINQNYGRIINIGSISSFQGARNIVGYVTAKHGLLGLTKCMAVELAPYGITCNLVSPGFIKTKMLDDLGIDLESTKTRIPIHRLGSRDDVANAVLFLASDESSYITGSNLMVDGGWTSR